MQSSLQPSTHNKKKHLGWYLVGGAIGLLLFGFLSLTGYYWWQFRFGEADTIVALQTKFENAFSSIGGANGPSVIASPESLIRPHNPTIGQSDAPITIIAFIDFECPYCRQAYPTFQEISEQFGPAVRVVFKHFPLLVIHPAAEAAAVAAQCAHEQGKFWEYYERIFSSANLSDAALTSYATDIGLNLTSFVTCQDSNRMWQLVTTDANDGIDIGVRGTPTYIVNGTKYEGVIPKENWQQILLHHMQDTNTP